MPVHTYSDNEDWNSGIEAQSDRGYRTLVYKDSLGGGTLEIFTSIEGVKTPVPDSKLTAATVDGNGQAVQQVTFQSSGTVYVKLTGATAPTATVAVL